jgi:pimeloyl-ACP methyl ester carboxylesterase
LPTIERNGIELYFADSGRGPAVLFHTGGAGDGRMWELAGYTTQLSGTRQLLLDHRGRGKSGRPTDLRAHRIDEYVADVLAVLDAAQVDRAVLIGYSAGAHVVFDVAVAQPDRCSALVAIGGPPYPVDVSESNRVLAAHLRNIGTGALMEELSASEPEPAPAWLVENLAGTETEMFALQLEAWADAPNVWDSLPKIATPTLMVVGELERGTDSAVDDALERLAVGEAFVSPGYGHLQNFWHAEVTAPVIAEFVQRAVRAE